MRLLLVGLCTLVACYDGPRFNCDVGCDFANNGPCPRGLECGADNMCHPIGGATCSTIVDASIDAPAFECFGMEMFPYTQICTDIGFVIARNRVLDAPIDTDLGCDFVRGPLCVIAGHPIRIEGTVRATGSRPLALIGDGIIIANNATLDLSGRRVDLSVGPMAAPANGNRATNCTAPSGSGGNTLGSGGGAGGSHGSAGGNGGAGHASSITGGSGTGSQFVGLQGGCFGGNGGVTTGSDFGRGGHPGGAVYLLGRNGIAIDGVINASGGGARAPDQRSGGGGGGSGGVIMMWSLENVTVNSFGRVLALGGGGSSGGRDTMAGVHGNDVDVFNGGAAAANAPGAGAGGAGGTIPGTRAPNGGAGVADFTGGGGGGGGIGHIRIHAKATLTAGVDQIKPPAL